MNHEEIQSPNDHPTEPKPWFESFWVDFAGVFLVFFVYAGSRVPEVNEVHYWIKAAKFWDPSIAPNDLFLDSGNAHWAFYFLFGALTRFLSLETSVWAGRFVTWIALAIAWTALCRTFTSRVFAGRTSVQYLANFQSTKDQNDEAKPRKLDLNIRSPIPSTVLAGMWLVGMEWGLWAGEWVVGGCESKGIAYAFLFGGLAALARSKQLLGWLLIGFGNWFHVISGLWVSATAVAALVTVELIWNKNPISPWIRSNLPGLLLCGTSFLGGAIPAILMDYDTPRDQAALSAMEQVYNRLGHHLSPIKFNESRWSGFAMIVLTTFSLILISRNAKWRHDNRIDHSEPKHHWIRSASFPFQFTWLVCCFAFAFSMIGLLFDLIFSHLAPKFASSILRFYWFRWNDVTLPLLASMLTYSIATGELRLNTVNQSGVRKVLGAASLGLVVLLLISRYQRNIEIDIPAGEKQSFALKTDSRETRLKQYEDWKSVCRWINENTDEVGLWLTPRRQQSFKWHTRRPELAVWKDMPQNAKAVVEWSARLTDAYKFDKLKQLQPLSTDEIERLVNKYHIRYVLLDLRVTGQTIPKAKQIYPTSTESNDSFAVLRYEPTASEASP